MDAFPSWVADLRWVTEAASAAEAADRVAALASRRSGFGGALLTLTTPAGTCVGSHGLTEGEREHFRARGARASLAERRANRARLRARAFPGTGITYVPRATDEFHVLPTDAARPSVGGWHPEDGLYLLVPGADGQDIGVLSLDAPADGWVPSAEDLGRLPEVEALLRVLGPVVEARLLQAWAGERELLLLEAQRLDLLGRVAVEVAHDLNNLMTVVMGSASLARAATSDRPEAVELLDEVLSAADRAAGLAHRLLGAGRRAPAGPQRTDLVAVVTSLEPLARRLGGGVLEVAPAVDRAEVAADPGRLTQLVLNLVANARDAGAGRIRIGVEVFEERGTRFARLEVTDDGRGMDECVRARIFEPFFTTREGGSGIGLTTVKRIVDELEGRIRVESAPGRGATFRIELPVGTRGAMEAEGGA